MKNIYLKAGNEFRQQQEYLMEGISEALYYDDYESFGKKLWELAGWVTSQSIELPDRALVDKVVDQTIAMVKGAHFFLHHKERLGFEDSDIDRVWVPNPYAMPEKHRRSYDRRLDHYLAHREERFQWLAEDEIQNFTLAFKRCFSILSLSDWLSLLESWRMFALDGDPVSVGSDFTPLKTYEQLAKLSEACFVALAWEDGCFSTPNQHLCLIYLNHYNDDGYDAANPLRDINWLFYEYDIQSLKNDVCSLFTICKHEQVILSRTLENLRFCLVCSLYNGWLLLQTEAFPEEWVDPDKFDFIHYPIIDSKSFGGRGSSLDYEQTRNPVEALWGLFGNVDVRDKKDTIEFMIARYYDPKASRCLKDGAIDTKRFLLKLLDILFLINLDLCKNRTIKEYIKYPEKHVTQVEVDDPKGQA
ncbi:hypothetical protein [Parapedobacter sp. 10938]|uniref:hypothetical protein n=1 Tax=Parapedobacter flavus TaxID=3110225 RepID=UPI002DB6181D|nr:hypothetical protein [Parapedobacter sp. 10938]MEC3879940.1 hypothetical protein [Parapedobacter sp. 10938]